MGKGKGSGKIITGRLEGRRTKKNITRKESYR
jgi:hypothetical protein